MAYIDGNERPLDSTSTGRQCDTAACACTTIRMQRHRYEGMARVCTSEVWAPRQVMKWCCTTTCARWKPTTLVRRLTKGTRNLVSIAEKCVAAMIGVVYSMVEKAILSCDRQALW